VQRGERVRLEAVAETVETVQRPLYVGREDEEEEEEEEEEEVTK
jgi:hypothetical protein